MEKIEKIVELGIDLENVNDDELYFDLGVDVVSFVESPAIEESFLYFSKDKGVEDHVCGYEFESTEEIESSAEAMIAYAEVNGEFMTHEDIIVDLSKEEFSTVAEVLQGLGALDLLTRLNVKRDEPAETYYRYQGDSAPERTFCKAMMRLANRGKMFTEPQIDDMGSAGVNSEFARKGSSTYSIFQWVGGKFCKHYWQKLSVFKNGDGKRVIIVESPRGSAQTNASQTWEEKMSSSEFHFAVQDEEQRIVVGPLMTPMKMILRRDEEGNPFYVYFSKETIAKMAEKFLAQNKQHNTDFEHDGNVMTQNTLIESWISLSSVYDKSHQMGWSLPAGTWFVSFRVNNDEMWANIKAGRARGFSLAGQFINRFQPITN